MIPTKSFYFIRHGETEYNKLRLYTGTKDIPLNDIGIKQAKSAAEILKDHPIDNIVCSTLQRAKQTAEIIAKELRKEVTVAKDIHERHLGTKEGTAIDPNIPIDRLIAETVKGEEDALEFQKRVVKGVSHILTNFSDNTLIVAHGGVFATLARAMEWPITDLENCSPIHLLPPQEASSFWQMIELKKNYF